MTKSITIDHDQAASILDSFQIIHLTEIQMRISKRVFDAWPDLKERNLGLWKQVLNYEERRGSLSDTE